jgi:dienelactone hydrolase
MPADFFPATGGGEAGARPGVVVVQEIFGVTDYVLHRAADLAAAGLDEGTVGFVVALEENTRDGLLAETPGDLSRLIGRPTTPLTDALRAALAQA